MQIISSSSSVKLYKVQSVTFLFSSFMVGANFFNASSNYWNIPQKSTFLSFSKDIILLILGTIMAP